MIKPGAIKRFGQNALLIEWGNEISESVLKSVLEMNNALLEIPEIHETIPSYSSITVFYNKPSINFRQLFERIENLIDLDQKPFRVPREWNIPVCYSDDFAFDKRRMETRTGLPFEEIKRLHHSKTYTVFCLGFLPGFAYLGKLDPSIAVERMPSPRLKVPAGSVGIAGVQTGIYPVSSPGGWNIIGRSPKNFFNPEKDPPCFIEPGDKISFTPITTDDFVQLTKDH